MKSVLLLKRVTAGGDNNTKANVLRFAHKCHVERDWKNSSKDLYNTMTELRNVDFEKFYQKCS